MVGAQSVADLENPVKGDISWIFLTAAKSLCGFHMSPDNTDPIPQ